MKVTYLGTTVLLFDDGTDHVMDAPYIANRAGCQLRAYAGIVIRHKKGRLDTTSGLPMCVPEQKVVAFRTLSPYANKQ